MILQLRTHIKGNSAKSTLQYIDNKEKNVSNNLKYLGFSNCSSKNIEDFNKQIQNKQAQYQCVKNENSKSNFCNHWILSFSAEESQNLDLIKVYKYADEFCRKSFKNYDCCYSIHLDKEHTHIHIVQSCYNKKSISKYRDTKSERQEIFKLANDLSKERLGVKTLEEYKKEKEEQGIIIESKTKNYKKYSSAQQKDYKDKFFVLEKIYKNSSSFEDFKKNCENENIKIEERIRRSKISSYVFVIENKKYTSSKFEKDIFQPEKLFEHYAEIKKQNEEKNKQDRIIQQKQFEINSQQKRIAYLKEMNSKSINTYINYNNGLPEPINDMLKVIKFFKELKRRIENKKIIEELEIKIKSYEETIKYFSENKSVENYLSLKNYYKLDSRISEIERKNENYQFLKNDLKHLKVVRDSIDDKEYIKNKLEELKKSEQYINLNTENIKDEDKYIEDLSSQLNNYKPKSYLKQKNKSSVRDDLRE